jgi:hypothetical protein
MRDARKARLGPGVLQLVVVFLIFLTATSAQAQQQTTGEPGAPDGTTTVDGRYLPIAPPSTSSSCSISARTGRNTPMCPRQIRRKWRR